MFHLVGILWFVAILLTNQYHISSKISYMKTEKMLTWKWSFYTGNPIYLKLLASFWNTFGNFILIPICNLRQSSVILRQVIDKDGFVQGILSLCLCWSSMGNRAFILQQGAYFQSWTRSRIWRLAQAPAHAGQIFSGLTHECHRPGKG